MCCAGFGVRCKTNKSEWSYLFYFIFFKLKSESQLFCLRCSWTHSYVLPLHSSVRRSFQCEMSIQHSSANLSCCYYCYCLLKTVGTSKINKWLLPSIGAMLNTNKCRPNKENSRFQKYKLLVVKVLTSTTSTNLQLIIVICEDINNFKFSVNFTRVVK